MVLEKLGGSLREALRKIAGASYVDESLIKEIVRDIQRAPIQADVNVQLALGITKQLQRRALEEKPPPELFRDPEGELNVHVRLDEGPLDVADDFFDERLVDVAGARDLAERLAEGAAEFFEDHRTSPKNGGRLSLAV